MRSHYVSVLFAAAHADGRDQDRIAAAVTGADHTIGIQLNFEIYVRAAETDVAIEITRHRFPAEDHLRGTTRHIHARISTPRGVNVEIFPKPGNHLEAAERAR